MALEPAGTTALSFGSVDLPAPLPGPGRYDDVGQTMAKAVVTARIIRRLLSSGATSFKDDLAMQSPEGQQFPGVSVFTRDAEGRLAHTYTGGAALKSGEWRGMDLLSPVWHFLDLIPVGRGDWMPRLSYD